MKKSLIALAALSTIAGSVAAQSSVTVYGLVDLGYATTSLDTTTAAGVTTSTKTKTTGNGDGALATSRLGFRGTEDLGGGLKANFVLENDLTDLGVGANTYNARYSWVGLESASNGQIRLGRQEQSIHSVVVGGSAGGANNVAGTVYSAGGPVSPITQNSLGGVVNFRPHTVFVDRAITYISPNFNGFTVEAQTATNETTAATEAASSSVKETGYSLKYVAGKLTAGYGYAQTKTNITDAAGPDTSVKSTALNATYDFGVAKAFALRTTRDNQTLSASQSKDTMTEIGVQYPMGKTVLWASMLDGERDFAPTATSFDAKGYQVGARYDLSKRTALYAIYGQQTSEGTGANSNAEQQSKGTAVGVRHSF